MKTKLTKELIEQAKKLIAIGTPQKYTAQALGIQESTWYEWLQKSEIKGGIYKEFAESVKKSESEAIARNVALIQKAAQDGNWQAAAWWLERRYPEEFGRKNDIALHGSDNALEIKIVKVDGNQDNKKDL